MSTSDRPTGRNPAETHPLGDPDNRILVGYERGFDPLGGLSLEGTGISLGRGPLTSVRLVHLSILLGNLAPAKKN